MKVVLDGRNAVVVRDLRSVLAGEPALRSVAVLYGAAHMHGLERSLVEELGYGPAAATWATTIRVDPRDAGMTPEQARRTREAFRRMIGAMQSGR